MRFSMQEGIEYFVKVRILGNIMYASNLTTTQNCYFVEKTYLSVKKRNALKVTTMVGRTVCH